MAGFEHTLPVTQTTVDARTGAVIKTEDVKFAILPSPVDRCQVCGKDHQPHLYHDCQSLFYQYAFYGRHGRWPTWADACAHCTPEAVAHLKSIIAGHAPRLQWSEPPEGIAPIAHLGDTP